MLTNVILAGLIPGMMAKPIMLRSNTQGGQNASSGTASAHLTSTATSYHPYTPSSHKGLIPTPGIAEPEGHMEQRRQAGSYLVNALPSSVPGVPLPTLPSPTVLPSLPKLYPTLPQLPPVAPSLPISLPSVIPSLPTSLPPLPTAVPTALPSLPVGVPRLGLPTGLPSPPSLPPVAHPTLPTLPPYGTPAAIPTAISAPTVGAKECQQKCEARCQNVDIAFNISQCKAKCASECASVSVGTPNFAHTAHQLDHNNYAPANLGSCTNSGPEALVNHFVSPVTGSGLFKRGGMAADAANVLAEAFAASAYEACMNGCSSHHQDTGSDAENAESKANCKNTCAQYLRTTGNAAEMEKRELNIPHPAPLQTPTASFPTVPLATGGHPIPRPTQPVPGSGAVHLNARDENEAGGLPIPSLPIPSNLPIPSIPSIPDLLSLLPSLPTSIPSLPNLPLPGLPTTGLPTPGLPTPSLPIPTL